MQSNSITVAPAWRKGSQILLQFAISKEDRLALLFLR